MPCRFLGFKWIMQAILRASSRGAEVFDRPSNRGAMRSVCFGGLSPLTQHTPSLCSSFLPRKCRWKGSTANVLHGRTYVPWKIREGRRVPSPPNLRAIQEIRSEQDKVFADEERLAGRVSKFDVWDERAVSHSSGLAIVFLGTGTGHPGEQRRAGAVGLKLTKSTWLFDAGEDTQRQVHKQPLIRHGKVDRIFITNRRSNNILGLPGLLCTMSSARVIGLDVTDVPLHIYGPPGLSEFIRPMLHLSDTYIAMPVVVHEFVEHAVPTDQLNTPQLLDKRCCLYRVLVPPDKLNPQGYTKAIREPMLDRGTTMTRGLRKKDDERVNHRPLVLPPPGDRAASIAGEQDLQWTIMCEKERSVTAVKAKADIDSFAYILKEADRMGRLNVEAAERYGIFGAQRNDVKAGLSVTNGKGEIVHPEQVCGPDIIGRKLAFVGECTDAASLAEACRDADAIVHAASCTVTNEAGQREVKSTIEQAALLTKASDAHHLLLYRFKPEGELVGRSFNFRGKDEHVASAAPRGPSAEAGPDAFGLNLIDSSRLVEKKVQNGYMRRAANIWNPVIASTQSKQAAGAFLASCLGGSRGYSLPDDMDLYIVDRRNIIEVPLAESQTS